MNITLVMIVKNEAETIERCLRAAFSVANNYVIVDTGSTDDTCEIVKQVTDELNIGGALIHRPWVNFAHNRNEAIRLVSEGELMLLLDADFELVVGDLSKLRADKNRDYRRAYPNVQYLMDIESDGFHHSLPLLVTATKGLHYEGVVHEYLVSDNVIEICDPSILRIVNHADGADSATRLQRNLKLLLDDERNSRTLFYLAETYRQLGEPETAIARYTEYLESNPTFDQEIFYATWRRAELAKDAAGLIAAYQLRPTRVEPLVTLMQIYRERGEFEAMALFASPACALRSTEDILFVHQNMYDYEARFEAAIALSRVGKKYEAAAINQELLAEGKMPLNFVVAVKNNLEFC